MASPPARFDCRPRAGARLRTGIMGFLSMLCLERTEGSSLRCTVHTVPAQICRENRNAVEILRLARKRILSENDEVRQISGADTSLVVLVKARLSTANRKAVKRLLDGKRLPGQIRSRTVQRAAGHGTLDPSHYVRRFHRAVGAVGDGNAAAQTPQERDLGNGHRGCCLRVDEIEL